MTPRWMLVLCSCLLTFLWASITRADDDDLAFTPAWLNVGGSVRAGSGSARDDVAIFGELGLAWDPPTRSRAKTFVVSDAAASPSSSLAAPTVSELTHGTKAVAVNPFAQVITF